MAGGVALMTARKKAASKRLGIEMRSRSRCGVDKSKPIKHLAISVGKKSHQQTIRQKEEQIVQAADQQLYGLFAAYLIAIQ